MLNPTEEVVHRERSVAVCPLKVLRSLFDHTGLACGVIRGTASSIEFQRFSMFDSSLWYVNLTRDLVARTPTKEMAPREPVRRRSLPRCLLEIQK